MHRSPLSLFLPLTLASLLLLAAPASARLSQQAIVRVTAPAGSAAPKAHSYLTLMSYLSTRDALSARVSKKANPVGKVFMNFPAGGTVNKTALPTCNQSEYATPATLASVCAGSVLGGGWALLNTGENTARLQLTGAPDSCPAGGDEQYLRTYQADPAAGPACTPYGSVWVKITAYQGGILKAQWWCYGDAGAPRPGAACTNKASGGDAKNTLIASGPVNGSFNDRTNAKRMNGCNIIFANDNGAAPLSFGGTVTGCKNRLTVIVPALNGDGAGLGELTGGWVLSDFYLRITARSYLKAGACPRNRTWTVSTDFTYSTFKGETNPPEPRTQRITSNSPCRP